jgi:hypothetical protein
MNGGVAESEEPVIPASGADEVPAPSQLAPPTVPTAAAAAATAGVHPHDPSVTVPPHLAQFYAHSRPEGVAMPAEPFLPPPPPPLSNPYASPQRWMYPLPPYLQTPTIGAEPTPSRFYQDRPPNPAPGTGFSTFGVSPYGKPNIGFGASFDGQQGSSQLGPTESMGFAPLQSTQVMKESGLGVFSPSGVTGSSMQVHPPSSPPIDPSTSIHPSTLSASHLGTVPVTSAGSGGVAGFTGGQVAPSVGGGGAKVSTAETKGGQGKGERTKDGGESMSSLPMSVPEGTR